MRSGGISPVRGISLSAGIVETGSGVSARQRASRNRENSVNAISGCLAVVVSVQRVAGITVRSMLGAAKWEVASTGLREWGRELEAPVGTAGKTHPTSRQLL